MTAKTRLATALNPLVREQLGRRIEDIGADIQALDRAITQIARPRGTLEERIRRLMTIPGIGRLTATTMLIDMLKAGKAKKVAITAIMRRIIILANTLLREKARLAAWPPLTKMDTCGGFSTCRQPCPADER